MPPEPYPAAGGGLVVRGATEPVGSAARLGVALVHVLRLPVVAVGHNGSAAAASCCDLFARHAVHGGYADGHAWQKITVVAMDGIDHDGFMARLATVAAPGVWLSAEADGVVVAHTCRPDGTPFDEEALSLVLRRIADNALPLPVNASSVGTITAGSVGG